MTQAWAGARGTSGDDGDEGAHARPFGGLVGRDHELRLLDDLLTRADVRLVTVVGLAGVGKSRLADEVLERLTAGGRPAVRVDLAGVHDAHLLDDAVAAADTAADTRTGLAPGAADALWARFGGEPVVVLLDHLDEVEAPDEALASLLEGYPLLQVLATSIRPLGVPGEHVLRLAPLTSYDDPAEDPGIALFLARASVADAAFDPATADLGAVTAVVRACGGLPLAIELAAARVASVPPAAMARQLEAATAAEVLRGGDAGTPERRRSVAAALEWTVDLLSAGARQTLEEASVFEGAADLDALAAVTPSALAAGELLDRVAELVDVQLVALDTSDAGSIAVRLTPLVRSFAFARLRGAGREVAVRDAHAAYFHHLCQVDETVVRRSWPDVLAALDHAMRSDRDDEALRAAVLAAARAGDLPGAEATLLPRLDALIDGGPDADAPLRVRALLWSASHTPADSRTMALHGEWTRTRLAEATALARSSGDQRALLEALDMTIRSLSVTLDLGGAVAAAQEGLGLAARLGDEGALGRFEVYGAMAAGSAGDFARAVSLAMSALQRGRDADDPITVAFATTLLRLSPMPVPVELPPLPELLDRCERAGAPFAVLHVLASMSRESLQAGDLPETARLVQRQLGVALANGRSLPFAGVAALALLAQVAAARGSWEDGVRLVEGLAPLQDVLVASAPTLVPGLTASRQVLTENVAPPRWEELRAEMAGRPLQDVLRLAVPLAREWGRDAAAPVPGTSSAVDRSDEARLTPRERDVLLEMARGGTNAEIADRLGLTTKTVMHHSVAIYRKLGVRGRTEATAWAFRTGLVPAADR